MSYDEQSDKLAGTIGLLKQFVPFREPLPTRAHTSLGISHARVGKYLKMPPKFSVEGP